MLPPYAFCIMCIPSSELYHKIHQVGWFTSLEELKESDFCKKVCHNLNIGEGYDETPTKSAAMQDFLKYKTGKFLSWNYCISIRSWDDYYSGYDEDLNTLPPELPYKSVMDKCSKDLEDLDLGAISYI